MGVINQIFEFLSKFFEWYYVVMPWEQAIFVRAGKNEKIVTKGMYFKIPFIDRVYIQQTRLRVLDLPVQTVSTLDGKTVTIKSVVSYCIVDMVKMYNSISQPEITLGGMVMSIISENVTTNKSEDVSPEIIEKLLLENLNGESYGLGELSVKITSWADVKTFRLIQDNSWLYENISMEHTDHKSK